MAGDGVDGGRSSGPVLGSGVLPPAGVSVLPPAGVSSAAAGRGMRGASRLVLATLSAAPLSLACQICVTNIESGKSSNSRTTSTDRYWTVHLTGIDWSPAEEDAATGDST
jgi:hypothetical protein